MGMSRRERRALRRIGKALQRSDPLLASMLEHADGKPGAGGAKDSDDRKRLRAGSSTWAPGSHIPLILF